jgi:flagellar biosynthesis protein FlhG
MDQASKLRALANDANVEFAAKPERGPRIITVTSGKGGVGKTNFVVNLGLCLAKMKQRVVIFDADLGLSNVDVLMGVTPPGNLYELLYNNKNIKEIIAQGPINLRFISGGSGFHELSNLDQKQRQNLINSLNYFQSETDFVLIDTGAGISKNVLGFVAAAEEVIVIVTPEPTSLADAYSLIKIMSKFNVQSEVNLIVNMASNIREGQQTADKIIMIANRFLQIKVTFLGSICTNPVVVQAVKSQNPFVLSHPYSTATKSLTVIAENLINGYQQPVKGVSGFIGKLISLFG